ncbi:MAG TPA: hypothetical protein DDY52_03285 [Candidatus Moranbacteria bacterium]|nr:hypothetical protein [Candidatus Moranbacteria bacterium]
MKNLFTKFIIYWLIPIVGVLAISFYLSDISFIDFIKNNLLQKEIPGMAIGMIIVLPFIIFYELISIAIKNLFKLLKK